MWGKRQTFNPSVSCFIFKTGPYINTTGHSATQSSTPQLRSPTIQAIIFPVKMKTEKKTFLENEDRKENLSWVPSVCLFFSILPKSVPSQALLFSIWSNDFHVQIISSLGKLCHQEAISNRSYALLLSPHAAPNSFTRPQRMNGRWWRWAPDSGFLYLWTRLFWGAHPFTSATATQNCIAHLLSAQKDSPSPSLEKTREE